MPYVPLPIQRREGMFSKVANMVYSRDAPHCVMLASLHATSQGRVCAPLRSRRGVVPPMAQERRVKLFSLVDVLEPLSEEELREL